MTTTSMPTEMRRTAGIAGLLYLIVVLTGVFALMYVPSQLYVSADAAATARNIEASRTLFRLGIVASMLCYVAFLVLPLALYRLLSHVHREVAVLMVVFAVASVPMSLLNLGHKFDILSILGSASHLQAFSGAQVHAQVAQSLTSYRNGVLITEIFWGLWLLPFGYLAFRSGTIPRVLGICLMLGSAGYLINVFGTVLLDGYATSTTASIVSLPSAIGEIGACLWLLFAGIRAPRTDPRRPVA